MSIRNAVTTLAGIDPAAARATVGEYRAEVDRLARGIEEGDAAYRALTAEIQKQRDRGVDGERVADEILAGRAPGELVIDDVDALTAQRDTLTSGNATLRSRLRLAKLAAEQANDDIFRELGGAVDIAGDQLAEQIAEATARLVALYAAAEGIGRATRSSRLNDLSIRLRPAVHELGLKRFVSEDPIALPRDVADLARAAEPIVVALGGSLPQAVPFPRHG